MWRSTLDLALLGEETLRDTLRAIRYAHPLAASPLLGLAAVTWGLRQEGIVDAPRTREWMLQRHLDAVTRTALQALRPGGTSITEQGAGPELSLARLREDFRAGSPALEAWSALYHRYLASHPLQMREMAQAVDLVERTLLRRLDQGLVHLVGRLRESELEAHKALGEDRGAPAFRRIVIDPGLVETEGEAGERELLAAMRDDAKVVRLAPQALVALGRRPPNNLTEYRLGRVAEWSQARFALDGSFHHLALLVF